MYPRNAVKTTALGVIITVEGVIAECDYKTNYTHNVIITVWGVIITRWCMQMCLYWHTLSWV